MMKNCLCLSRIILLLLLALTTLANAGIENYFKLPPAKPAYPGIKNVDYIYMINLDQRPEKYLKSLEQLSPFNVKPYRFSAVNGWELSFSDLEQLGINYTDGMKKGIMGTWYPADLNGLPKHELIVTPGKNYFSHCMSRGAIGICLSHLSVLQDAYNSGYKTIWVMEDDIEVIENPHTLSRLISKLDKIVGPKNWDVLFTDPDTKNKRGEYVPCLSFAPRPNFSPQTPARFAVREDITPDLKRIGARYGTYSVIMRRSGIKKMLAFLKKHKIFLPYDMEITLPDDIKMYSLRRDIVSTLPDAASDNGKPRYLEN